MIYITQHRSNDIVNRLSIDRTQAAKQGLEKYLDELSERAKLRGELIAEQEELILALREYYANDAEDFEERLTADNYEAIKTILDGFIPGYDFLSICDADGIVLARSDSGEREYPLPLKGYNVKLNPDVEVVFNTGRSISTISFMLDNSTFIVGSAIPVYDAGEFLGVITCFYDLTHYRYLERFKEQSGSVAAVFVEQEYFSSTFSGENGDNAVRLEADEAAINAIFNEGEDYFISFTSIDGLTYGTHYSPLIYHGEIIGMLFTGVDISEAMSSYRQMTFFIVLVAFLGVVISIGLVLTSVKFNRVLDRRLEQQMLMTEISQSFLSEKDMDTLITNALKRVGEFMKVSQILLFKTTKENRSAFTCTNEWMGEGVDLPSRIDTTFKSEGKLFDMMMRLKSNKKFYVTSDEPNVKEAMKPYRINFLHNYLTTSIFINERLHAVLDFARDDNAGGWNSDDINMASFASNILTGSLRHKFVEEQLIAAKDFAEQNNKYKGIFLAHMSHEIRTPMNAILGISEIQLANKLLPKNIEEAFSKINESGSLLINIINDILDFSKIEAGKLEISPVKYEIPSLISDTVLINHVRYENKPIEFKLSLNKNTPLELFGDELRIKQILNNLLSNAFKYTAKGEVSLAVSCEHIKENDKRCTLVLHVKDTGSGMNKNQVSRIFDEYTRFNMQTNRTITGTGLGMSITKRLIDMMKGEITIKSIVGTGTEFVVRIPQKRINDTACGYEVAEKIKNFDFKEMKHLNATHLPDNDDKNIIKGKVLVVDDVNSNLYVAEGMLVLYGLEVETASSGFETIDKIKAGQEFDIIFMDHMMPQKDGMQTTKELRELGYTAPVVALTANAVIGQAEVFLSNGFDDFISKPINVRQLDEVLKKFIKPDDKQNRTPSQNRNDPKLRKIFRMDIQNAINAINETYALEDLRLFTTTTHGIKTVLEHMGEYDKAQKAAELEAAGLSQDVTFIHENTGEFIENLQTILTELVPENEENDSENEIVEDLVFLNEKLNLMKVACIHYDTTAASRAYEQLKTKQWKPETTALLEELHDMLLLSSEFEEARKKIKEFMTQGVV
jgi:signal transduction histidine kinase/DNA-binding response OmpR family regulator